MFVVPVAVVVVLLLIVAGPGPANKKKEEQLSKQLLARTSSVRCRDHPPTHRPVGIISAPGDSPSFCVAAADVNKNKNK
jgi:hypothetical protein